MAEYIERAAALDVVKRTSGDYVAAWSEIAHMPAADVAEVVRCKDCVWRGREECAMFYRCDCGEQHTWETDNDFCSYGARMGKEDEHEVSEP